MPTSEGTVGRVPLRLLGETMGWDAREGRQGSKIGTGDRKGDREGRQGRKMGTEDRKGEREEEKTIGRNAGRGTREKRIDGERDKKRAEMIIFTSQEKNSQYET